MNVEFTLKSQVQRIMDTERNRSVLNFSLLDSSVSVRLKGNGFSEWAQSDIFAGRLVPGPGSHNFFAQNRAYDHRQTFVIDRQ